MATTTTTSLSTLNTTTVSTTTTTTAATAAGFFQTADGGVVLTFLVLIFILLLATPIIVYILIRKFCWIKIHNSGQGEWQTRPVPSTRDKHKKTQTDVVGLELDEFYRRRQPIDMSTYTGKKLENLEPDSRWHQLNPKNWNDPWSTKYPGKETNYIQKAW